MAWAWLRGDALPDPDSDDTRWEHFLLHWSLLHPSIDWPGTARPVWEACRAELLEDWISERPGTRPWPWWRWESAGPRLRLGGTGQAHHEVWGGITPEYTDGIPDEWLSPHEAAKALRDDRNFHGVPISLSDPPTYESQATYLSRNRLLLPYEAERLPPGAYDPEALDVAEILDAEATEIEGVAQRAAAYRASLGLP